MIEYNEAVDIHMPAASPNLKSNTMQIQCNFSKPLRDGKMLADIEDWEAEGVPKRNRDLAEALMHKLGISI